jgi:hypothetical protein
MPKINNLGESWNILFIYSFTYCINLCTFLLKLNSLNSNSRLKWGELYQCSISNAEKCQEFGERTRDDISEVKRGQTTYIFC